MAALSKRAILSRIADGNLVISPILAESQLGPSSVDLRMGTVVLVARAGGQSHVEPAAYLREMEEPGSHASIRSKKQKHERYDVPFRESFLLHPGTLALVPTLEWVKLPDDLQGVVTARSSWAREGLNIATATIVNPGYMGIVTLELANFGEIPIRLYPGLRLAQIAFYDLDSAGFTERWLKKVTSPSTPIRHKARRIATFFDRQKQVISQNTIEKPRGQFQMSFEPSAGNVAKDDGAFISYKPNP
ncbi:deoxycytidine triphosphate deaminase [Burkholderia pseudomallei 7894]|uniref:dCTP deaminase n=1 Tax=Burkholderia pseudomallei TaxID=28450 RepID=UPI0005DA6334|nr:dCTP deaminase [Burkholderia pseudomallei]AJX81091.1 deoxycytidine triphosphate deaminase [Burkholderia pseudomallei 7894]ARK66799.1 dCTP deaminase [Burkholderia pseudomallei]